MGKDPKIIKLSAVIPDELANKRFDQALANLFPDYSRSRLQDWIKNAYALIDNKILRAKDKVIAGQTVTINARIEATEQWLSQAIKLDILYEDSDIIVVNKPTGLVVHPGAGQKDCTLLNALLHKYPELAQLPRAGIIHRLDKDTSGLLVITRTLAAHTKLVKSLQKHKIKREYEAIVFGNMIAGGTIDAPIGRHRIKRTAMAVTSSGKPAITHYRVLKRFSANTHLQIILETGRTHQIRVHLAHIGYPIVGDRVYGGRLKLPANIDAELRTILQSFPRQALHAKRLALKHPQTGKLLQWEAPAPQDFDNLLKVLEKSDFA
jgi:23S rRNA pseudouridine1911/1915/1917 synthase